MGYEVIFNIIDNLQGSKLNLESHKEYSILTL